ncbi:anti-sigma 24 factor [Crenobacter intestini]|uniref:Anti-sigma 24 factor n=2 Tax=Crenobacter intestini TaxID=2563443 RepID=A0A4T0V656_9NEIS|nr:anti-sigma 24 factor [Crenobacter intestini]
MMNEKISALMDGELSPNEVDDVSDALLAEQSLSACWSEYHLIGEAMRRNGQLTLDVREKVSVQLRDEPTVLSPRAPLRQRPVRRYAAMAATVAFAAAVGWVGFGQDPASQVVVAQAVPASQDVFAPASGVEAPYLAAHQEAAGGGLVRVSMAAGAKVAH